MSGADSVPSRAVCYQFGRRKIHRWKQERPGRWPYDGQLCCCGEVEFVYGIGVRAAVGGGTPK